MNPKKLLAAFAVAACISGTATTALAYPAYPAPSDERSEREADAYDQGTDHIDEAQWEEAVSSFARVVEMKGSRADGATYWTAYALNKLGRRAEALQAIEGLKKSYPSSRWLDDAKALELELRQARGERVAPASVEDDELKMMAINSLMHTDPEKAYPLLEKIVRGNTSKKIRERALFVLSQSGSSRAQTLLGDIARGKANPDLQKQAVRYLGMSGNAANRQLLADMYASGAGLSIKKEILRAFMISGDKTHVVTAARGEKDPALRSEAIRTLGIMGGRAELASMYGSETSRDVRDDIIQALFLSGDTDKIGELARGERDAGLRKSAIQKLGLMGSKTTPTLLALYAGDNDPEVKEGVLHALFLQGNAKALIDIAKKEQNKDLKKKALRQLSIMNDEDALAYMLQILNE